jgi:LysM repeat protein
MPPTVLPGTIAGWQQAASATNLKKNFGVGEMALTKGPFQCPPGFDLYVGQCIPRTRVLGAPPVTRTAKKATSKNPYPTHRVRFGNTTSDIASMHGVSVEALVAANPQKQTRMAGGRRVFTKLFEGERVNIPSSPKNLSGVPIAASPISLVRQNPFGRTCLTSDNRAGYMYNGGDCQPILRRHRTGALGAITVEHQTPIGRTCLTADGRAGMAYRGGACKAILAQHPVVAVKQGDNTSSIAARHGVSVRSLIKANPHKPLTQRADGVHVFAHLVPGERVRVPATGARSLAGYPGTVGDVCNPADSDFDVVECAKETGGMNPTPPTDPNADPTGGSGTSITGVFCGSTNERVDLTQTPPVCVCDNGYLRDATGTCVEATSVPIATGAGDAAQSLIDTCNNSGGSWNGQSCDCPNGVEADGSCTSVGSSSDTNKGGTGGGGGTTKTGGTTKPTTPGATNSLAAPSKGLSPWLLVGGLVLAAGAVGGGAYAFTKHKTAPGKGAPKKLAKAR